ncbi:MAG: CoA transferase [Candidatus Rokubacteria bacterium]|nr:CoA transferase [Candidatus Rokubacteria bacterium]
MTRLLEGVRLVDLTTQMPGPYCSMILADLGADVIKVEPPSGDQLRAYRPLFDAVNRGKRSVALDLRHEAARGVLYRLAGTADLMLEGFRPGVAARLGADYGAVSARNPAIVYCSISGFGQDGPDAQRPGHDLNYLALSGILGLQALIAGEPSPPPVLVSDLAAGQYATIALLAALAGRRAGAPGQYIDLSMTDGAVGWTMTEIARLEAEGRVPARPNVTLAPHYGVFRTADDRWVTLGIVYEDHFWRNFCDAVGLADLRDLPNVERLARFDELRARIVAIFAGATRDEWVKRFEGTNVPFAPVLDLPEVLAWPQFRHRGLFTARGIALPMKYSAADTRPGHRAPELGEHMGEILDSLGYTSAERAALAAAGAVRG